jgi:acyl-CoA synthetase (AMP-forming)/AMP-acid ligase II
MGPAAPWAVHLRKDSRIPLENEAARRYLRGGNLPQALLTGGPGPALVAADIALSHDELKAAAETAAGRLSESGVTREMVVVLFADSSASWIVSYLGLQLLGATVVGMNPGYKEAEAAQILTDSGASMALLDAARQPLIDWLRSRLPALKTTARIEEMSYPPPQPSPARGEGDFGQRAPARGEGDFGQRAPTRGEGEGLQPEDPALILYTSATPCRSSMGTAWASPCMAP